MTGADLDRDIRLAERLGELPPPTLPPGLAARIVAGATCLPQDRDEPLAAEAAAEPRGNRRPWLPFTIGTAIAASVVAVLVLRSSAEPVRPAAEVQVAESKPAPQASEPKSAELAAVAPAPARAPVAALPRAPKPRQAAAAAHASPPGPAVSASRSPSTAEAPQLVAEQPPIVKEGPAAQALVGPPAIDDRGAPMLQSEPPSGLGISGTAAPGPVAVPAPSRPGRGASTMPRF